MSNNVTEQNLKDLLENILDVQETVTLNEFIDKAISVYRLNEYDLGMSSTRPNEIMIEQRCRNIVSHKNFPPNVISYKNQIFSSRQ
ncbi:MAG: hypothetical protein RR827_02105 [Oscillospiraceae bacterium]